MNIKLAFSILLVSFSLSAAWYDGPSNTNSYEHPSHSYSSYSSKPNSYSSDSSSSYENSSSHPDFSFSASYHNPKVTNIEVNPIIETRTEYVKVPVVEERIVTQIEYVDRMHQPDFNNSADLKEIIDNLKPQVDSQNQNIEQCDRLSHTIPGAHTHFQKVKEQLECNKDNKEGILFEVQKQYNFVNSKCTTVVTAKPLSTEFGAIADTEVWLKKGCSDNEITRNISYYKSMGETPGFSDRFLKKCDFYPIATFLAGVAGFCATYTCVDAYMKQPNNGYNSQPKPDTLFRKGIRFGLASLGALTAICVSHKIMDAQTFYYSSL